MKTKSNLVYLKEFITTRLFTRCTFNVDNFVIKCLIEVGREIGEISKNAFFVQLKLVISIKLKEGEPCRINFRLRSFHNSI